jgi:D-alanyl-lipoteichoic acid acyltransferase DltB (MBOAT superfamily)
MRTLGPEVLLACVLGLLAQRLWSREEQHGARLWTTVLLSAGVLAYWQPKTLLLALVLCAITGLAVRMARRPGAWRRSSLGLGVAALLSPLLAFKYAPWLLGFEMRDVPIGLSFTVFRLIGILLDAVNLNLALPAPTLLQVALFFPTFRAGPITTLQSFVPLAGPATDRGAALRRIFLGLCRKLLLADNLSTLVLTPWLKDGVEALSGPQSLLLPILFGLRIYWDFAGYTDVAIGTAALLGYRVPENFDRPYLSRNLVEFWRRWHITLSEWIRLRLFMKMVGRRSPKAWLYGATVISMALCGLWHGAGWGFLLWGVWHGVGIVAVHLFGDLQRKNEAARRLAAMPGQAAVATALTFAYVSAGWLLFFLPVRSALFVGARALEALASPAGGVWLLGLVLFGLLADAASARGLRLAAGWARVPALARGCAYAALAWGMAVSLQPEPFVYFRF